MSKICKLTNKKVLFGNNRSHSMNKTKRKFNINIQNKKIWIHELNKFIKIKLSTKALRIINKNGTKLLINKK